MVMAKSSPAEGVEGCRVTVDALASMEPLCSALTTIGPAKLQSRSASSTTAGRLDMKMNTLAQHLNLSPCNAVSGHSPSVDGRIEGRQERSVFHEGGRFRASPHPLGVGLGPTDGPCADLG